MSVTTAKAALALLVAEGDPARAASAARFFKTGPGEYGEGDRFLGLGVPATRAIARRCELPLAELERLLASEWHEARLLALVLYVRAFAGESKRKDAKARAEGRRALYESYLAHTRHIDNWDLVDVSAGPIVGAYLADSRERSSPRAPATTGGAARAPGRSARAPLTKLARSTSLWERRIAIIATLYFIKLGEADETLRLAALLLDDEHDLIHKAVGWMLREVGKSCGVDVLRTFLEAHAARMPRTMLRYAIERLEPRERAHFMAVARESRRRDA